MFALLNWALSQRLQLCGSWCTGKAEASEGTLHICWGRAGRADESIRNALDSTLALAHSPSAIRRHMIKAPQPPLCILRMHIHFRADGRDKAGGRKASERERRGKTVR